MNIIKRIRNYRENNHVQRCKANYDWLMESKKQLENGDIVRITEDPDDIKYNISIYHEYDGSVTAASNDMDLAENAENEKVAIRALAESILEYAHEFRDNHYDNAPNRKTHIPFVEKALLLGNARKIRDEIIVVTRKQIIDKRRSLAEIIGDWKAPDDYELCDFGDTKNNT